MDGTDAMPMDDIPLTVEHLLEAIQQVPPDPLAELMRRHGYDPEKGWRLLWPASLKVDWGPLGPPGYARLTGMVDEPTVIKYTIG